MSKNSQATAAGAMDLAIGSALHDLRKNSGFSVRQLAKHADISAAMISRIENGLVSPSTSTLTALSVALDVPLISLFRKTASDHGDFTHVKKGEGLKSTRIVEDHCHEYIDLALHIRKDLQFEARMVTLVRQVAKPPVYVGHGVVFVYVIAGEAIYHYGQNEILLKNGDSLSLDAEINHGFKQVISPEFTFLSLQVEPRK